MKYLLAGKSDFDETGFLPVVVVEAVNTGPHGIFSTKAFTQRMLDAVKHPILSIGDASIYDDVAYQKMRRKTEAEFRSALERALIVRRTKYLFIDEAQHVKYVSNNTQAENSVMDSWKCLAQTTGVVLVVVGAYPILGVLNKSPHLLGRKHQVHLPRYRMNRDDLQDFSWILANYDQVMDIESSIGSLRNCSEFLYEGSLGCIGLLRGWLSRASAFAAIESKGVTKKILGDTVLSDADLAAISQEIKDGESLLKCKCTNSNKIEKKTKSVKPPVKKKLKPFKRKPKRYRAVVVK